MSFTFSGLQAFYEYYAAEYYLTRLFSGSLVHLEFRLYAVLLCPLQEFALEVDFFLGYAVEVEQAAYDAFLYEPFAVVVAAVEINGANEGFEGIATYIIIV